MPVSFNNIPSNLRVPLFYAEIDNSAAFVGAQNLKSLIIGQKLPSGSAEDNELKLITSKSQAKSQFGIGSMIARAYEQYRKNDPFGEVYCIALPDNASGVKADGNITFAGTATEAGTLNLYIAGQRVQVPVSVDDTAAELGDKLEALLGADESAAVAIPSSVPVTGVNTDGDVAVTARHAGEIGNDIDLRANYLGDLGGESTPAGITVSFTAMSGGVSNPELDDAIAAIGDESFEYIDMPYTDTTSLNAAGEFMNDTAGRWSWIKQLYGHVFSAKVGTVAALDTFGDARNDQHVTVFGYYDSPTPPWEAAAMFMGQAARSFSIDAARPIQTLPLIGFMAPPVSNRFSITEANTLLFSGISTSYVEGGQTRIQRAITTYRENAFGEADASYLDVTTLMTTATVLRRLKGIITSKYPRHKLASDGTRFGDGQAIVTPSIIRSELIAEYSDMEEDGLVENIDLFKEYLIVERDNADSNRVNVLFPPDYINQLRVFALLNQFRLQYND